MHQKEKIVAFSGHRTEKLPQTPEGMEALRKRLADEIDKAIQDGFDTFIMGACYGFDLMAAQEILRRKKVIQIGSTPPKLKLIAAVPYEEQANN